MPKKLVAAAFIILLNLSFSTAKEGKYYEKLPTGDIQCLLCPRECVLREGQTGTCRTRKNVNSTLETLVYAKACSINIDPVEKKPLFHFMPDTKTFSIAAVGCTLRCVFCQNWTISQSEPDVVHTETLMPDQVVGLAKQNKCPSISYTYSEPTAWYEYMYDSAFLARQNGIKNIWVTCGYINQEPLKELCKVIDAVNVDLKGFSDKTYRQMTAAKLEPVLDTIVTLKKSGVWLEVGYLVIPTINDSDKELNALLEWFSKNLGPDVPLHFLRFFPQHKLTGLPSTPIATLERAYKMAKDHGLNYVYIGNVPGHKAENTYCPKCKKMLIGRKGYFIEHNYIKNGACSFCGKKIAGVWK